MDHGQTMQSLAGYRSHPGVWTDWEAEADHLTGLLSQIGRLRAQRQRKADHEPLKGAHHRPLERGPGQYVSCSLTSPTRPHFTHLRPRERYPHSCSALAAFRPSAPALRSPLTHSTSLREVQHHSIMHVTAVRPTDRWPALLLSSLRRWGGGGLAGAPSRLSKSCTPSRIRSYPRTAEWKSAGL